MPDRSLKHQTLTAVALVLLASVSASPQGTNLAGQTPPAGSSRLQDMEQEMEQIREQSRELGGNSSPKASLDSVQTRINQLDGQIETLGRVMDEIGANAEGLRQLREEYGDTGVVGLSDIPEEGAEKVAETCVKRACTRYGAAAAAPWVGWISFAGDVVDYGGQLVIREINELRLRELVSNETAKHSEVFELLMAQYCERKVEQDKAAQLRQLRQRENVLAREIAVERQRVAERQRQAERAGRATRHANQRRETDYPGDLEEWRKHQQNPPTRRLEIGPADQSSQGAMNLSPFARDVLAAHNRERARYGAAPLQWNSSLEATATAYADEMARTGSRVHAARAGRGIERENINQGMLHWSTGQMLTNWVQERGKFTPGTFPNVCSGDWSQCGHYTQIVWPTTTDVGCGMASGGGFKWLVCRYSPGGNKEGQPVGTPEAAAQSRLASARRAC